MMTSTEELNGNAATAECLNNGCVFQCCLLIVFCALFTSGMLSEL